jgi:hypothetical protein
MALFFDEWRGHFITRNHLPDEQKGAACLFVAGSTIPATLGSLKISFTKNRESNKP